MDGSTIAAIATPPGIAGIGIIKISGPDAVSIASTLFRKGGSGAGPSAAMAGGRESNKSHRLQYGHIIDPQTGSFLDEVLLSVMHAPRSYTGETVVEINTHSGMLVLRAVLELVLRHGARLAAPGEFTRRAFLNGRIDLTQAEAVIDVITARTEKALDIAAAHMTGEFRDGILSARDALLGVLTQIEAAIDFPEDVEPLQDRFAMETLQQAVATPLTLMLNRYRDSHVLRDGMTLAVVGRPNVGKSSLMNRLIQKDRVIVSPIPGTTRDYIEEGFTVNGIPLIIADTPGLHPTSDPLEALGIQKTRDYISRTDLVLFLIDASVSVDTEDLQIFETIRAKNVILVLNKQDLVRGAESVPLPERWQKLPLVRISALYDQGIDGLKDAIAAAATGNSKMDLRARMIPNVRHKGLLDRALRAVDSALQALDAAKPAELVAIDLQEAAEALADIVGISVKEDVLEQIFSRFCIGK